jgi:hypothetical protein
VQIIFRITLFHLFKNQNIMIEFICNHKAMKGKLKYKIFINNWFYIGPTCAYNFNDKYSHHKDSVQLYSCCVMLLNDLPLTTNSQQTFFFLLPLSRATVFTSRTSLSINVCCLDRKFRRFCQSALPFNNVCKESTTTEMNMNVTSVDKKCVHRQ